MRTRTEGRTWTGSGLKFAGLGHYFPRHQRRHDTEVTISGRTYGPEAAAELGVRSLHVADEDETLEFMAVRAAEAALANAGREAGEADLVILANWTDRQWIPEIAPGVAHQLGADKALAFDVCGACTGFVHGVQTAASMLSAHPGWQRAVVVAADRFTRRARPGTRGQLVFGDAAGAVVLEKGDPDDPSGLLDSVLDCDSTEADTVAARPPEGFLRPKPELIDLAVRSSLRVADNVLSRNELKTSDIDWLVPHPGNNAIHAGVRDGLDLDPAKFLTNFATRGNTGCASIPIALSEFTESGVLNSGDLVLSTAVGSGWYYGGLLYRL
ncbi:ketoacyl-ACP synthase III [Streptomyces alanosinicus]|uniref:3-oxoacyl-ACP synthase n=1 Tax=Streptomyces alanosinicus TaxID=68171 RepID=A0A918YQE9_9ACTN|nr:ketoacyl-ACP synthase III [Streptomyces alanosinicus]GHE12673.1 3-oxoacyl-ACP synthase [Streptomyces alanosinicus]